ncbi:actin [Histomonas meleagridis]|uniref:actin n=1 Tax=Histomonas meleagridis TaxID=135588 RepID=UPI00355AA852|nr:actin [Histomonas meleagridis]KAH0801153.1 actin [Histomonas meleagridis]
MEKIWSYLYNNKLKVDVTEHPVLLTDAILNPKSNREKMIQIQFETFNVPAFYVAYQPYLPLLASGTKTGIVLESGGGVSQILPIYEFKCRKTEARKTNLAGESITDYLQILINEHENTFISNAEKDIIRDIKEKHSYVAIDYDEERYKFSTSSIREIKYTLPNKDIINISEERFKCGELLFKPMLNGFEEKGIHRIFYDSINSFKIEEQKSFYQNIVVSGGNTALKGFPERMYKEIVNIAPPSMCIKVIAPPELRYGVWIGGSIFASLNWFPQCVITRDEYDEEGTQIVHRMCQ